ncbi:Cyclic nucleotide-gated ion channel 1 [Bienertia sinuspersici]
MSSNLHITTLTEENQDEIVRFEDQHSDVSKSHERPRYSTEKSSSDTNRASFIKAYHVFRKGYEKSSLSFQSLMPYQSAKKPFPEERILDPQGKFLQKWNKIFLISCVFAMAWDSLFFYVPVIDGKKQCLKLDENLELIACILRTLTDLFYLLHIILQFRTGFISPSSRVLGRGELIKDHAAIASRYLSSYFTIDILAVLPFPQMAVLVIIPRMMGGGLITSKGFLKLVIFIQNVPRLIRVYPLFMEVTRTSGIITETAWAGAAFNLFLYMLASHVFGAIWYIFSIDRQGTCWRKSCIGKGCHHLSLYCKHRPEGNYSFNITYCKPVNPDEITDSSVFNFGLFYDALNSEVVQSTQFLEKFFYCFWWGFQNLSSLGQNLKTSTFIGENLFSISISVAGLLLFSLLIGNMQKYLESTTVRVEEMRIRRQDAEQWMSHRLLPEDLRERIRRYDQYRWQVTRGVDEESIIHNLPMDLRRDIKRHLCLDLLMRVPIFAKMDEQLKDAMCDRLKPVLYTENSFIIREGDPVNEMLFIMRGNLLTMTTNGGRTGIFNSVFLKAGDFCGEALLTWALDPHSLSNLPISTRTVLSKTEVEAFALISDDLKFLALQFRRLNSKQLRHTFRQDNFWFQIFPVFIFHKLYDHLNHEYYDEFRFYSQQWRTWAVLFIQAAWRTYYRRKLEKSLQEAEQCTFAKGGSKPSLGATIYASKFAVNALRKQRHISPQNARILLQKPTDSDPTS